GAIKSITNLFNVVSTPISTAGPLRALNDGEPSYPDDPSMPHLEDIYASPSEGIFTDSSYNDDGVVKQKEDGIFKGQDKYIAEILKKFDFLSVKTAITQIETQKPLVKDKEAIDVDVHLYSKELASPKKTTLGKDTSNPLIVDSLLKTIWLSMYHVLAMKHWLFQSNQLLIVDFLNVQVIQYALMVNPTIYVSCIKQFSATVLIKKANDVVMLQAIVNGKRVVVIEDVIRHDLRLDNADGVECLTSEEIFTKLTRRKFNFSKYIFDSMVRNVDSPSKFLMYLWFLQFIINAQVDYLSTHTNQYTSTALTQKVFANMRRVGKGFSGVKTPLFVTMLVQPQAAEEEDEQ
nr:ribonuclease H-like domain, reverse transcriptase, RNA-dependent DNA polymerase [Tanacetum cinerariifolium]